MRIKCPDCNRALHREGRIYTCPECRLRVEIGDDLLSTLKEKLREIKAKTGKLSIDELKRIVGNREHPVTKALIGFTAWGIAYFVRFPLFMAVAVALAILLGP